MVRRIQAVMGKTGYRNQLDRARRFLDRVNGDYEYFEDMDDQTFQDMMWAFFQNCWHVKDWIENDPLVPRSTKDAVIDHVHSRSPDLKMCQQLCNGTKHLGPRPGASHRSTDMTIDPARGRFEIDCTIDDGHGNLISGKELAHRCVGEWERVLESHGLATARSS